MAKLNYETIGLKLGLEIHQQLNTKSKLFCDCPTSLSTQEPTVKFLRRLRPTQSELGQVDPAAFFEFQKGRTIVYEADKETSCLVEMDEEPPHALNPEALELGLTIAYVLKARPIEEIHVMRKIVIDGSNTTGFQRTCVVAIGGYVEAGDQRIPIQHTSLEEDAARKTNESGMTVYYRIDRLGIPLVEVATAPVIHSPEEAEKAAYAIGRALRATRKVKRGLGAIRQDLNISIPEGALIEIKGVQKLDLIRKVAEYEVQRQLALLKVTDELRARGLKEENIEERFVDVTDVFRETACKIVRDAISKGRIVLAVLLPKFNGLLKVELQPNLRLGTEMAHRAMYWGRVSGIFHTDELPGYGIEAKEIEELRKKLNATPQDAVVLVADSPENAMDALKAVVERAKEALRGVPEETRGPNPDGTTRYMRPRPGAARMYPETDVPPVPVTELLMHVRETLPPMPDQVVTRLIEKHGLNKKLAEQLLDSDYLPLFESIAEKTSIPTSFIATILTEVMKSLEREGVPVENLSDSQIEETFRLVDRGVTAKESAEKVIEWLSRNPEATAIQAVDNLKLRMMTREELEALIEKRVSESTQLIRKEREAAFPKLMNVIMGEVRGKADAKIVTSILKSKMEKLSKA